MTQTDVNTDKMKGTHGTNGVNGISGRNMKTQEYSVRDGAKRALEALSRKAELPSEILEHLKDVVFTSTTKGDCLYFPCPFKETEAASALKAVEASAVAAIADLRYGEKRRKIEVNLEKTAAFLFSTYIATIGGLGKQDPSVKSKLKGELLNWAE